jgi:hypothetical protein
VPPDKKLARAAKILGDRHLTRAGEPLMMASLSTRYLSRNQAKSLVSRAGKLQVVDMASHQKLPSARAHLASDAR